MDNTGLASKPLRNELVRMHNVLEGGSRVTWDSLHYRCSNSFNIRIHHTRLRYNLYNKLSLRFPCVSLCRFTQIYYTNDYRSGQPTERRGWVARVQISARRPTILSKVFRSFPQSLQTKAGIVPFSRSRPLPSTSYSIHYSPIKSELVY
jgi:hypothetical protein